MSKSCLEGDSRPRDCCERLVFVGGMGTADTSLHLLCACSLKGERARCYSVRRNRGPNTMLLASMTPEEGMGACLAVEGATTSIVFEAYFKKGLVLSLRRGQVVMDNLSAHKGERVRELVKSVGC